VISDSEADFAGYDLGPSSPELQLGVLGSCLTHTFLIQAATLACRSTRWSWRSPASSIRAPVLPDSRMFRSIRTRFAMPFSSPPPLRRPRSVCCGRRERNCPILNLLRQPQVIAGEVRLTQAGDA
jgi:hypothetical protein